jgi:hypothetical protein
MYRENKQLAATYNTLIKRGNESINTIETLSTYANEEWLDNMVPTYSFPKREMEELKTLERYLLQNDTPNADMSS